MRVFQRSSQAYEPDHAKAANSYPCFSHAGSDCDSSTIKANLPDARSERLMLQKWPRTEVHLSSLLQYPADPWSAGPAEFSEAGEPDYSRCIQFPSECCTFAAGYCTCEDQPHFDLQLQAGFCKCYGCHTRMLEHLIQSLLMSAHRFNAQSFPTGPITRPPLTDSLDLSMTWTSAATRRADWVTGNRAQSTHVQYTSCTPAVATSFHMIAGAAGRRSLPHCGASFSGGSFALTAIN